MPIRPQELKQIVDSYKRMAVVSRYRPGAPSDGLGNVVVPLEDLDLEQEALQYAATWNAEENAREFHVGVCNFPTRPATIFAIEAARNMCGAEDQLALRLLRMAVSELERQLEPQADGDDARDLLAFLGEDAVIAAIEAWAEDHEEEYTSAIENAFDLSGQQQAVSAKPIGVKRAEFSNGHVDCPRDLLDHLPEPDRPRRLRDVRGERGRLHDPDHPRRTIGALVEYHDLKVTPGGGY